MNNVLVVYSGGLDSYTLLRKAIKKFDRVEAITFNYGQKHSKEIEFAKLNCKELNVKHEVVNLELENILSNSALVGDTQIPEGNYDKEKMKQTIVPNRNMIMISVAASLAIKNNIECLWYAAHSGDHEIYPDCRPEFIKKMAAVLEICDYHKIKFEAPFQSFSKSEIVKTGLAMGLDYSKAWTCYEGKDFPCNKCSACLERAYSFEINDTKDPLNVL
tara:strand:- start:2824 stop:3474 length:651 start_codon:yes stop_codon:yes gene_type:complete